MTFSVGGNSIAAIAMVAAAHKAMIPVKKHCRAFNAPILLNYPLRSDTFKDRNPISTWGSKRGE
jgi:hypothetical protein